MRQFGIFTLAFAFAMGAWLPAGLADSEWKYLRTEDGIEVYKGARQDTRGAFMATAVTESPIGASCAVLSDDTVFPQWYPRCTGMRRIRTESTGARVYYIALKGLWPMRDRDAICRTNTFLEFGEGGREPLQPERVTVRLESVEDPLFPESKGHVRIKDLNATWTLDRLSPETTRITYAVATDMGGAVPAPVARLISSELPCKALDAMRTLAEQETYRRKADEFVRRMRGQASEDNTLKMGFKK